MLSGVLPIVPDHPQWFISAVDVTALTADCLTILGCSFVLFSTWWFRALEPFSLIVCGIAAGDLLVGINGVVEYMMAKTVQWDDTDKVGLWVIFTLFQITGIIGATVSIVYSSVLAIQALWEIKKKNIWKFHIFAWLVPTVIYGFIYAFNFTNQLKCIVQHGTVAIWIGGCAPNDPFIPFAIIFCIGFIVNFIVSLRILVIRSMETHKKTLDTTQPKGRDSAWTRERITANKIMMYGFIFLACYTPLLVDYFSHWTHTKTVGGNILGIIISMSVASQGWLTSVVYLKTETSRWQFFSNKDYLRLFLPRNYGTINSDGVSQEEIQPLVNV